MTAPELACRLDIPLPGWRHLLSEDAWNGQPFCTPSKEAKWLSPLGAKGKIRPAIIAERERVPKIPAHDANDSFWSRLPPLEDRRSDCPFLSSGYQPRTAKVATSLCFRARFFDNARVTSDSLL
jgi:hypothetical protein